MNILEDRVARVRDAGREKAKGMDDKQCSAEYREFLISHDAVKHAQDDLERHLRSTP